MLVLRPRKSRAVEWVYSLLAFAYEDWFSLHSVIYRLALGALVLAVVIPLWTSGHHPMWPVALITISVVTAVGVVLAREPHLRDWMRRQ
jgi:MFS superfamily sulfate permease-like transporter